MRRCLGILVLAACASSKPTVAASPAPSPPAPAPTPAAPSGEPAFMTSPPKLPEAGTFVPPAPSTWRLANGLEVVLVERHDVPLVTFALEVRAGSNGEPAAKAGLASLTANLLDEGAGSRGTLALAEETERLGAELETRAGSEASVVEMTVLSSRLGEAAALFADVVLRPRFEAKDLQRVRIEQLGAIAQRKVDPRSMAALAAAAALYGDSPFGRPIAGYEGTVAKLGAADVRGFYDRYYRPGNAVLVVVGDVGPDDLKPRLDKLFGDWKAKPVSPLPEATPVPHPPRLVLVDKPGAAQSSLRIVEPAIPRVDADYASLQTTLAVLGGSFTSRLTRNLRERNNYTYGASASVQWQRGRGPLSVNSEIFTDVTAPAIAEALKELEGIHGPFVGDEVQKAKALLRQGLVEAMGSTSGLALTLAGLIAAGAPLDSYQRLDADLAKLEEGDLQKAAASHIHADQATIVVVGDLAKIRPAIEKLGLGAGELHDADGKKL